MVGKVCSTGDVAAVGVPKAHWPPAACNDLCLLWARDTGVSLGQALETTTTPS